MADFLAPVTYTAFKSPVPAIDVGVWANIAEMGFKQNMLMQDMLDKSYQSVAAVNPTLNQDKDYVNKKKEELDKKLEAFTNKGPFISPKNMGAIRQLSREYAFDKEFQAINNRTAKIAEVNKQIADNQLPEMNYMDYKSSIDDANAAYDKDKVYNPNVNINYNVTPYAEVSKTLFEYADKIPELKNADICYDDSGNYMFICTTSGRNFEQTQGALMAALGGKEISQLNAEYRWLEAKSPESLVAQKDITDPSTGLVKYKKGTKLTFDEFATNEVLKITAAMTGQSFDMSGLQKTLSAEVYLAQVKEDAKNNGKGVDMSSYIMGQEITASEGVAVGYPNKAQFASGIKERDAQEANISNLEQRIAVNKNSGVDTTDLEGELKVAKAKFEIISNNVTATAEAITSIIPTDEQSNIWNFSPAYQVKRFGPYATPAGSGPGYKEKYLALAKDLEDAQNEGAITNDQRKELLSLLPFAPEIEDDLSRYGAEYIASLQATDIATSKTKVLSSDAYKAWASSSWRRGSVVDGFTSDGFEGVFNAARIDKNYIDTNFKAVKSQMEQNQNDIGVSKLLTANEWYTDSEGHSVRHPIFKINQDATQSVRTNPGQWIDVRSGDTLDKILTDAEKSDIDNVNATITATIVNGHQLVTVTSAEGKAADLKMPGKTYYVYNVADPFIPRTLATLQEGGVSYANEFKNDIQLLAPLQAESQTLMGLPNSASAQEAIDKDRSIAIVMPGKDITTNEPVKLKVYKLSKDNLLLATQVGSGTIQFETNDSGEYVSFKSLRHIAQYIGGQSDLIAEGNLNKAQNVRATSQAAHSIFNNETFINNLMPVIGFETGGEYSPATVNKLNERAVGLIQFFTNDKGQFKLNKKNSKGQTIEHVFTKTQLMGMTHSQQMGLIRDYYVANNVNIDDLTTPAEVWLPVFMPALHQAWQNPLNKGKTVKSIIETQTKENWAKVKNGNKATGLTDTTTLQELMDNITIEIAKHKN